MPNGVEAWSMIRKSMPSGHDPTGGNRFSLATNASVARGSCSNKRYSRSLIQPLTVALKQAGRAFTTVDAHLVRLAARHRPGDKAAERFKATFFCVFGFH